MEAVRVLDDLMPEEGRLRPEVLEAMAGYLEANGQVALAGLQYEMAADDRPGEAYYPAQAARWYAKAGNRDRAAAMVERVRLVAPRHPVVAWWDTTR